MRFFIAILMAASLLHIPAQSAAYSSTRVPRTMGVQMVTGRSDSTPGDFVGEEFGPYRLVRRLGVGGMAQTFEAVRHGPAGFSQHVCLKLVLPYFRESEDFVELFKQEAKLAAKLRHSNIVGIIDFGEIGGVLYMALELVDGVDLRVLLDAQDRKRLAHEYVTLIGRDVARALERAHSPSPGTGIDGAELNAIIHRDVSPSNVLISRHGEVMLTDFGVAKAITDTWGRQSNVKGKIPYMSPEQLMGEAVDGRADLYSLGVLLFEALTGRRPYVGPNDPATIMMALAGNHVPLSELAPDTPPDLCDVVERLLEPDRERRPQTATELIELLDELAPPARTRRKLGELVIETPAAAHPRESTGIQRSGGAPVAALAEAPTTPVRAIERSEAPSSSDRMSRRQLTKRAGWALLAAGGVAGVVMTLWPEDAPPRETVEVPTTTAVSEAEPSTDIGEPSAEPVPEPELVAEQAKTSEGPTAEPQEPAPSPRAHLTVVVFPFGDVWINGVKKGTAPLKNQPLKPGVYKVSVGQGSPSRSRTVRLRPGERESLIFDLTKPAK